MVIHADAHVEDVIASSASDLPAVVLTDGPRQAHVSWDGGRCTYRADVDLFSRRPRPEPRARLSVDQLWQWSADNADRTVPDRLTLGHRFAELVTIDALVHRLETSGFSPDGESRTSLLELRSAVEQRWGDVVLLGRPTDSACQDPAGIITGDIMIGLPDGRTARLAPLLDHPDHRFGWGGRADATIRTARALIDVAWSVRRDAATDAAAIDLAFSVLADVHGAFVWRAESVADRIAADVGDLESGKVEASNLLGVATAGFHQLSLAIAER